MVPSPQAPGFDLVAAIDTVEQSPQVSFILDASLRLAYRNQAWNRFAQDNGAPELAEAGVIGTDLRSVIGNDLRPFYLHAFETVAREKTVWQCFYECSSPDVFRKFQMRVHPLARSGWYLVINNLVNEHPHSAPIVGGLHDYVNSDGMITICMHCRCSRRATPPERWDFVPAYLDRTLTHVTHGLCPLCLEYFYPKS